MKIDFKKACKSKRNLTDKEKYIRGIKDFKKEALGLRGYLSFFGSEITQSTKDTSELANLFYDNGIVSSLEQGLEMVNSFEDTEKFTYNEMFKNEPHKDLVFERVKKNEGDLKYRVSVWTYPDITC